jgi:hypothetical protein
MLSHAGLCIFPLGWATNGSNVPEAEVNLEILNGSYRES